MIPPFLITKTCNSIEADVTRINRQTANFAGYEAFVDEIRVILQIQFWTIQPGPW